jgi:hypothetical protein
VDRSNGLYHIVTCTLDTEFEGTEVDLVMNTTLNADGSSNSSAHVDHSALSDNDTMRIMVQLESICDDNILQVLNGAPRKKGVFAKYHPYFLPVEADMSGDGALQGLRNIISTTQEKVGEIADAIGSYLHSSGSGSVSFLNREGEFTRYSSCTNSFYLRSVNLEQIFDALDDLVTMNIPMVPHSVLQHLRILAYGTKDESSWTTHTTHFSQLSDGLAATATVFHIPHSDGTHDLAICTVLADFEVEGLLEVITTTTKWLGGLIQFTSTETHRLPPVWSSDDTSALNNFMMVECLNDLSLTWTKQGPVKLPDVSQLSVLV